MHLLTSPTGRMSPVMYSIQLRTVESWNGCLSDSSSQKNPLLYGSPHKKSAKIGNPTINIKKPEINKTNNWKKCFFFILVERHTNDFKLSYQIIKIRSSLRHIIIQRNIFSVTIIVTDD